MELWIRTNPRIGLVKVNDIYIYSREGMFSIESKDFVLGMYKTEERAIEILDHIQFLIEQTGELTKEIVENIRELLKDEMWSINSTSNTATYEMPKE